MRRRAQQADARGPLRLSVNDPRKPGAGTHGVTFTTPTEKGRKRRAASDRCCNSGPTSTATAGRRSRNSRSLKHDVRGHSPDITVDEKLAMLISSGVRLEPSGFTPAGAPIYDAAKAVRLNKDFVPITTLRPPGPAGARRLPGGHGRTDGRLQGRPAPLVLPQPVERQLLQRQKSLARSIRASCSTPAPAGTDGHLPNCQRRDLGCRGRLWPGFSADDRRPVCGHPVQRQPHRGELLLARAGPPRHAAWTT